MQRERDIPRNPKLALVSIAAANINWNGMAQ